MDADANEADYEMPMLTGLLLLPIGKHNGVYRRVGQFEMSRQWIHGGEEDMIEHLSKSTGLPDQKCFVSKHKRGRYTICIV